MIKLMDILNEIGDATIPVVYKKLSTWKTGEEKTIINYGFEIEGDEYVVNTYVRPIEKNSDNTTMTVIFTVRNSHSTRTNKGVQYQVMSTITQILKDYVNEHPELVEIAYEPVKNDPSDEAREKLYRAYVKKNIPNWNYSKGSDGYVYITKPGYTKPPKSIFQRFFKK